MASTILVNVKGGGSVAQTGIAVGFNSLHGKQIFAVGSVGFLRMIVVPNILCHVLVFFSFYVLICDY